MRRGSHRNRGPVSEGTKRASAQKRILADAFAGHDEWRISEILDAAVNDKDMYFDAASQVRMPSWRLGRVVLVGDAQRHRSVKVVIDN
jgi:2-polyprenyl-6-methoxyphenol hydroxylase-like FAD-dependent oxidoreductase